MSHFASFLQALSSAALDTLAGFDAPAALAAGVEPNRVREWAHLHEVYLAPSAAHRQQAEAAARARQGGFSLDQLALIERRLKELPAKDRGRTRVALLMALVDAHPATYRAFAAFVKTFVPVEEKPPREQVTFSKSRAGKRTFTVTGDERRLADLEHRLSQNLDPAKPIAPQLHDAFFDMLDGGSGSGVAAAAPRPTLLIPLPEWVRILRGEGDDTVLGLSDGTSITGADFLARYVAGADNGLEAALFHPQEGPVNLYRVERFANQKQRDLAKLVAPVCPVPGCRHGADSCEAHHVVPWRLGGETNLANLAPLCRYHNRVNDDDPRVSRRGRIAMVRGAPVWVSPRGHPVPNSYHPFGAMRALFGDP